MATDLQALTEAYLAAKEDAPALTGFLLVTFVGGETKIAGRCSSDDEGARALLEQLMAVLGVDIEDGGDDPDNPPVPEAAQ